MANYNVNCQLKTETGFVYKKFLISINTDEPDIKQAVIKNICIIFNVYPDQIEYIVIDPVIKLEALNAARSATK